MDADILKAGHPELIFELDGQSVAEPKHWSAAKNGDGAQAWAIKQEVALREMSWQLANEKSPTENQINRWNALVWLIQTATLESNLKTPPKDHLVSVGEAASSLQSQSDEIARNLAATNWTDDRTRKVLFALANTGTFFGEKSALQQQ